MILTNVPVERMKMLHQASAHPMEESDELWMLSCIREASLTPSKNPPITIVPEFERICVSGWLKRWRQQNIKPDQAKRNLDGLKSRLNIRDKQ